MAKSLASLLEATPPLEDEPEATSDDGLAMAAEELMAAMEAKDATGIASALRSAFDILGTQSMEMPEE